MPLTLRSFRSLALLAAFMGVAACQVTTDKPAPHIAAIQAGNGQTAPAGTEFPTPLGVIVLDQYDFASANVQVTWTITAGGGTLSATSTQTNETGVASTVYTAGPTPGTATITADIAGVGQLTFTETIS
jgi:hypothetical protein